MRGVLFSEGLDAGLIIFGCCPRGLMLLAGRQGRDITCNIGFTRATMETLPLWGQVLLGIGLLLVVLWFWPGVRAAMEKSRKAQNPDWQAALIPLMLVALFCMLLIVLV